MGKVDRIISVLPFISLFLECYLKTIRVERENMLIKKKVCGLERVYRTYPFCKSCKRSYCYYEEKKSMEVMGV